MKPTFVLSLDTELIWGSFDHTSTEGFYRKYGDVRGAIREILTALEDHEMAATWAMVGHLFLDSCERGEDGRVHPEILRPQHAWFPGDWLRHDPASNRHAAPLWYGDDILALLRGARVPQEIACHSFSHVVFGDPGCSDAVADSELKACVRLAEEKGLELKSFVFPRNVEGHHALLAKHGFTSYRGQEPSWYRGLPGLLQRGAHFADQGLAVVPPVSLPQETLPGLFNIPASMLFLHRGGIRRAIPFASRVLKAKFGLHRAVFEGAIFHLWFHPFNFCVDRPGMIQALRSVLGEARRLRDQGRLQILTMGALTEGLRRSKDSDARSRPHGSGTHVGGERARAASAMN